MPFLLKLLKNPKIIVWTLVISCMVGLFMYGKIQYVQVKSLQKDLLIVEKNVNTLEDVIKSQELKMEIFESSINERQEIIDDMIELNKKLRSSYSILESQLDDVLGELETTNPSEVKTIENRVTNSYKCIESASGNEGVVCEE